MPTPKREIRPESSIKIAIERPIREIISKKLHEIEEKENIRILLAVESGSRAWGFASPDSDYDVRFIYVHPRETYLRLDTIRDVIELPLDDILDINGWDLRKALLLLAKSNPTLFEWFTSPIIYLETEYAARLKKHMQRYFASQRSLYHYLHMAEGNYREYLKDDMVIAKKYLYVLRPILACRWIRSRNTPPPMLFSDLLEAEMPRELRPTVNHLLEQKMRAPEITKVPRIDAINRYLDDSLEEITKTVKRMEDVPVDWEALNRLFLEVFET